MSDMVGSSEVMFARYREGQQCQHLELAMLLFQTRISALDGGAKANFRRGGLATSLNVGVYTVAASQDGKKIGTG